MAGAEVSPIAYRQGEGETFCHWARLRPSHARTVPACLNPTPPLPASEPPDMDLILRTAAQYGIEILGPPGIPEENS